jgi:hypothetical protein
MGALITPSIIYFSKKKTAALIVDFKTAVRLIFLRHNNFATTTTVFFISVVANIC